MKQKQWIVKGLDDQVDGPYSFEEVVANIRNGIYSEVNFVAEYPSADWVSLNHHPEFQDIFIQLVLHEGEERHAGVSFLDSGGDEQGSDHLEEQSPLEKSVESSSKKSVDSSVASRDEITQQQDSEKNFTNVSRFDLQKKMTKQKLASQRRAKKRSSQSRKKGASSRKGSGSKGRVVELQPYKKVIRSSKIKFVLWTVILVMGAFGYFLYFEPSTSAKSSFIQLQSLPTKFPPLDKVYAEKEVRKGIYFFSKDTVPFYLKAQAHLLSGLSRNPTNAQTYVFLCLTYLELWPYTYKSSSDYAAFSIVLQKVFALDKGGVFSSACRSIFLIARSRYIEADNVINSALKRASSSHFFLYYLKGLILFQTQEFKKAYTYLDSARRLEPEWLEISARVAWTLQKMERYSDATMLYGEILKKEPKHALSLLQMGIIEKNVFKHAERAKQFLEAGLHFNEKVNFDVLAQANLALAELALATKDTKKALSLVRKAYTLNPTNRQIKNLLLSLGDKAQIPNASIQVTQLILKGDQYFQDNKLDTAQNYYHLASLMDLKNAIVAYKMGQTVWRLGFEKEGIAWLEKAIRLDSKFISAYVLLAEYYSLRYEYITAIKILSQGARARPQSYDIYRGSALLEFRRNNFQQSIIFSKKALELYPYDQQSLGLLGRGHLSLNQFQKAFDVSLLSMEIDPFHQPTQEIYALSLLELRGFSVALNYVNKLLTTYPSIGFFYFLKGKLLLKQTHFQESIEAFYKALEKDRFFREAYFELTKAYVEQGHIGRAIDVLIDALLIYPSNAQILFELGKLYSKQKKTIQALEYFKKAYERSPLQPLLHYNLGLLYFNKTEYDLALKALQKEKELYPTVSASYVLSAKIYEKQKKYDLCIKEHTKAIKYRKSDARIYVNLARCHRLRGSFEVALIMLERARSLESGFGLIYKEFGKIYEGKGDSELAIRAYQRYFQLYPNASDVPEIKSRLGIK